MMSGRQQRSETVLESSYRTVARRTWRGSGYVVECNPVNVPPGIAALLCNTRSSASEPVTVAGWDSPALFTIVVAGTGWSPIAASTDTIIAGFANPFIVVVFPSRRQFLLRQQAGPAQRLHPVARAHRAVNPGQVNLDG